MGHEGALWATKDYRAIWRYRGWSEWYRPDTLARFEILLDLDPAAFARAIDRVPSYPARQAIMECIELDKEPTLAVDLLASAPLFADPSGMWTGSTFALILLDTLARHAKRALHARIPQHFDASPQVPLDKSRIESLYGPFFHAVALRPDAPYLGMALSLETVRRATHPRAVAGTTWTVEEVALEQCVDALTKMGTSFEDVQTDWRRTACAKLETDTSDQAHSPMSHLLLAACLLASRSQSQRSTPGLAGLEEVSRTPDVAAKVWAWYQELLRSADAELGGHLKLYGEAARWVFDLLGFTLASLDDPLSELKSQWLVLYEQRLRGRMVADVEAARPSFHLLRVARASLEWFVGGSEMGVASPERAESMWNCIHGIARQLPGSIYHDGTRRDRDVLTTLYAFLPGIRPDGWRDTLARDAPLFAVDEISCITTAANLVRNGVKASEVRTVMQELGCDPMLAGGVLRKFSERIEPRDSAVIGALQLLEEVRA